MTYLETREATLEFAAETPLPLDEVAEFFREQGREMSWVQCADVTTVAGNLLKFGLDNCSAESPELFLRRERDKTIIEGEIFSRMDRETAR